MSHILDQLSCTKLFLLVYFLTKTLQFPQTQPMSLNLNVLSTGESQPEIKQNYQQQLPLHTQSQ